MLAFASARHEVEFIRYQGAASLDIWRWKLVICMMTELALLWQLPRGARCAAASAVVVQHVPLRCIVVTTQRTDPLG